MRDKNAYNSAFSFNILLSCILEKSNEKWQTYSMGISILTKDFSDRALNLSNISEKADEVSIPPRQHYIQSKDCDNIIIGIFINIG